MCPQMWATNLCYDAAVSRDSLENLIWMVIFVALSVLFYIFLFRGRRRGFEALASRATQLQQAGLGNVYYLYANREPGDISWNATGSPLNTGCLAYARDGALIIESPWWNVMQPRARYDPQSVTVRFRNDFPGTRPQPGIALANQVYIVAGVNITEVAQFKQLWDLWQLKDIAALETNRQILAEQLVHLGFHFSSK